MASSIVRTVGGKDELHLCWATPDGKLRHSWYTNSGGWHHGTFGDTVDPTQPIALSLYAEGGDPATGPDKELHFAATKKDGTLYHAFHNPRRGWDYETFGEPSR